MRISLVAVVLLVATACGGTSATDEPEPPPTSALPDEPPPDTAPPAETTPTAPETSTEVFERHADPALEDRLPSVVVGARLTKFSLTSDDFVTESNEMLFESFLDAVDRPAGDVTLAMAVDRSATIAGVVNAIRVRGADATSLLDAVLDLQANSAPDPPEIADGFIGGRNVKIATHTGTDLLSVFYVVGDTAFVLGGTDEETAKLVIEAIR